MLLNFKAYKYILPKRTFFKCQRYWCDKKALIFIVSVYYRNILKHQHDTHAFFLKSSVRSSKLDVFRKYDNVIAF